MSMKRLVLTALAFAVGLPWALAGGDCRKGVTILFTNDAHTHAVDKKILNACRFLWSKPLEIVDKANATIGRLNAPSS